MQAGKKTAHLDGQEQRAAVHVAMLGKKQTKRGQHVTAARGFGSVPRALMQAVAHASVALFQTRCTVHHFAWLVGHTFPQILPIQLS